jgi:hypothetical protein
MSMNFFDFPAEIRLQIYEELFVLSEPIVFRMSGNPSWPPLYLHKRYGLCPALLRASKSVYHEASPLLYSRNRFEFTDLAPTRRLSTKSSALTSFFSQTGDKNTSFIRHLCIDFPTFSDYRPGTAALNDDSIKTLELIREKCTNIAILETSLRDIWPFESYKTSGLLELLDARFKAILSLKEVIVPISSYKVPSNDLKKKMRDCGWTVNVTILVESEESEDDLDDVDADVDNYIAMLEAESEEEMDKDFLEEQIYRILYG